jgi:hypothetical protein
MKGLLRITIAAGVASRLGSLRVLSVFGAAVPDAFARRMEAASDAIAAAPTIR